MGEVGLEPTTLCMTHALPTELFPLIKCQWAVGYCIVIIPLKESGAPIRFSAGLGNCVEQYGGHTGPNCIDTAAGKGNCNGFTATNFAPEASTPSS